MWHTSAHLNADSLASAKKVDEESITLSSVLFVYTMSSSWIESIPGLSGSKLQKEIEPWPRLRVLPLEQQTFEKKSRSSRMKFRPWSKVHSSLSIFCSVWGQDSLCSIMKRVSQGTYNASRWGRFDSAPRKVKRGLSRKSSVLGDQVVSVELIVGRISRSRPRQSIACFRSSQWQVSQKSRRFCEIAKNCVSSANEQNRNSWYFAYLSIFPKEDTSVSQRSSFKRKTIRLQGVRKIAPHI